MGYFSFKRKYKNSLSKLKFIGRPIAFLSKLAKDVLKRILFKTNMFENLGIDHIGPVDGHNIKRLEAVLKEAKLLCAPTIVHVCTEKGKGYPFAEREPERFHGVSAFDVNTGKMRKSESESFS